MEDFECVCFLEDVLDIIVEIGVICKKLVFINGKDMGLLNIDIGCIVFGNVKDYFFR